MQVPITYTCHGTFNDNSVLISYHMPWKIQMGREWKSQGSKQAQPDYDKRREQFLVYHCIKLHKLVLLEIVAESTSNYSSPS